MILEQAKEDIQGIIHCAFEVYNELHGGLLESVYEEAFTIELHSQGYHVEQQKELSVWYKGFKLDKSFRMDIVVNDYIIIEFKAIDEITPEHRKQPFNYMRLSRMSIGLPLNFSNNGKVIFEKYWFDADSNRCHAS
ncbi:MAG: GxxExxY protein [Prevotella sp.]|nr:GxxExxY protein [Prevotella sp.]